MTSNSPGFHIAAFAPDGETEGPGFWSFDKLSAKWLRICGDFLAAYGEVFDTPWQGPLAHIRTKFTSSAGVALVTLYAHGRTGVSMALATGQSGAAESELLRMFVESLRKVEIVAVAARSAEPFKEAVTISQRPLAIVVMWGDLQIPEEDQAVISELALHLAGAFFQKQREPGQE